MDVEVYEPNKQLKLGINVWPGMCRELWHARDLVGRLFLRNFSVRYKQSLLGVAWAVIMPGIAIGTFVLLKKNGIIDIGPVNAPYPVFALVGLSVFQIFSSGAAAGCGALTEAGDMIAKVNFPRETLILAAVGSALVEFMVKMVLIGAVCLGFGFMPSPLALLAVPACLPVFFFTLGAAFFLAIFNAVFRDTAQLVTVGTMFLLFLTPVLYPAPLTAGLFFKFNPLTSLVEGPRDIFLTGALRDPQGFMIVTVISLLVFLAGWRLFHLVEVKIPERL